MNLKVIELNVFKFVRATAVFMPLIFAIGMILGGVYSYAVFFQVFIVYGLIEVFLHISGIGMFTTKSNEHEFRDLNFLFNSLNSPIYLFAIMQIIACIFALYYIASHPSLELFELVGIALSMGIMNGSVGGLCSHELMHRREKLQHSLGIAELFLVNYAHFDIYHIQGHHVNVGKYEDCGTARYRESAYHFLARTLVFSFINAFKFEAARMKRQNKSLLSLDNKFVRYMLIQTLIHISIISLLGIKSYGVFMVASAISITLMEIVNYISHYGLVREKVSEHRYETIQSIHSWESNNKVTNWFIFNAGKHVHHHIKPNHHYYELEVIEDYNYLPHGLPLMTIISFMPPLYFKMMDKMLEKNQLLPAKAKSERRSFTLFSPEANPSS